MYCLKLQVHDICREPTNLMDDFWTTHVLIYRNSDSISHVNVKVCINNLLYLTCLATICCISFPIKQSNENEKLNSLYVLIHANKMSIGFVSCNEMEKKQSCVGNILKHE